MDNAPCLWIPFQQVNFMCESVDKAMEGHIPCICSHCSYKSSASWSMVVPSSISSYRLLLLFFSGSINFVFWLYFDSSWGEIELLLTRATSERSFHSPSRVWGTGFHVWAARQATSISHWSPGAWACYFSGDNDCAKAQCPWLEEEHHGIQHPVGNFVWYTVGGKNAH